MGQDTFGERLLTVATGNVALACWQGRRTKTMESRIFLSIGSAMSVPDMEADENIEFTGEMPSVFYRQAVSTKSESSLEKRKVGKR